MVITSVGVLVIALQAYAFLYMAYLWTPALAATWSALRAGPPLAGNPPGERSFTVLLSAHNEEAVIGSLLRSLVLQHYPAEKIRVHVVANNCTDSTAEIVRTSGMAVCHERTNGGLGTKGAALSWLWKRIGPEVAAPDVVLILDADNLLATDFLAEMNRAFATGHRVVQAARRAKNAGDSWASQLDAISEALWNRLDQAGRMRLGLSATIAGSGMAFERDVFEWLLSDGEPGLLEDIEWQARLMLAGMAVAYAERATVYDEKTSKAGQLGRQRKRWAAGVAVAARRYGWQLLASGVRSRNLQQLVAGFGATKPPRSLLLALMGLLAVAGTVLPAAPGLLPWPVWAGAVGSFAVYVILGMALDRARPQAYLALLLAPAFAIIMIGASVLGGLRPSKQRWVPTAHARDVTIDHLQTK